MDEPIPKWMYVVLWLSKGLFLGSVVVFVATHDLTPGENPGGFGGGFGNLVDIIFFYGPAALVGLIGWAWSAWLIRTIRNRGDRYY
jgi:hypothetical protein